MAGRNRLLLCDVYKGMFSDEKIIEYPPDSKAGEYRKTVFTWDDNLMDVESDKFPCKGWLKVTAYARDGDDVVRAILHSRDGDIVAVTDMSHLRPLV